MAGEPAERRGPREGEVPREALPRHRGRHKSPERQLHEAQGHGEAEGPGPAAGDYGPEDNRGGERAEGRHRPEGPGAEGDRQGGQAKDRAAAPPDRRGPQGLHEKAEITVAVPIPRKHQHRPHERAQPGEDPEAGVPQGRRQALHPAPAEAPLRHPYAQERREGGDSVPHIGARRGGGHMRHLQARGDAGAARGAPEVRPVQRRHGADGGISRVLSIHLIGHLLYLGSGLPLG